MLGVLFLIVASQHHHPHQPVPHPPASPTTAAIHVSIFSTDEHGARQFNKQTVLPLSLIVGELVVLGLCLMNGLKNHFNIKLSYTLVAAAFYSVLITLLVVYSILNALNSG